MWIDPNTGAVARTHSEIRQLRPNWSAGQTITEEQITEQGLVPVATVAPQYDPMTEVAIELAPELVEGVWTQVWEIADLPVDQAAINLSAAIAKKNTEINRWRLEANFSTFTHQGKQIACDTLSRSDIDATTGYIALFGTFEPDWQGGWKAVDNTYVVITTVEQWKAFYKAMYDQGQANFARAQTLKAQLASATTQQEIDAIVWEDEPE